MDAPEKYGTEGMLEVAPGKDSACEWLLHNSFKIQ